MSKDEILFSEQAAYEHRITAVGGEEEIEITICIPLEERLAQLVDRSGVRVFDGEYDERTGCIVLFGRTQHSGCHTIRRKKAVSQNPDCDSEKC